MVIRALRLLASAPSGRVTSAVTERDATTAVYNAAKHTLVTVFESEACVSISCVTLCGLLYCTVHSIHIAHIYVYIYIYVNMCTCINVDGGRAASLVRSDHTYAVGQRYHGNLGRVNAPKCAHAHLYHMIHAGMYYIIR